METTDMTEEIPDSCVVSVESFKNKNKLQRDLVTHATEKLYACLECGTEFICKSSLLGHMRSSSACKGLLLKECTCILDGLPSLDKEETSYNCTECGKIYVHKGSLEKHYGKHLQYDNDEQPLQDQIIHYLDEPNCCSICSKLFKSRSGLKEHMKIHAGQIALCIVCGKSFTRQRNLERHMRIHTGERPYNCSVCNKTFSQQGTLQAHQRTHTGEKPYLCCHCGKAFSLPHGLEAHVRTHTGEKPFLCSICQKAFVTRGNLQVHMKCHLKV